MTEEQLSIARSILEDYKRFSDVAAHMGWAETDHKCIEVIADKNRNLRCAFFYIGFEKGYVSQYFEAAFVQMMLTMLSLYEEWDPDKTWGEKYTSPEDRTECFVNGEDSIYGDYLKFKEVCLDEMTMEELYESLTKYAICVYDHQNNTHTCHDAQLPDDAKAMLSYFDDAKIYSIGCESWVHTASWDWVALKGDVFLYVHYFEGWG